MVVLIMVTVMTIRVMALHAQARGMIAHNVTGFHQVMET